jgi:hypothetical protein
METSLKGRTFGVLTVTRDHGGRVDRRVLCRCVCGFESRVIVQNLLSAPDRRRCSVAGCTDRQRARGAA